LIRNEHNARLHLTISIIVVGAGGLLRLPAQEWRWLCLAIGLVMTAEAFNTAVEQLCDRIEPAFDPVIGRVKDLCAAAVLMMSGAAAGIGVLTFGPPLKAILSSVAP
jgi:diacylglycerol kinase (ATP)